MVGGDDFRVVQPRGSWAVVGCRAMRVVARRQTHLSEKQTRSIFVALDARGCSYVIRVRCDRPGVCARRDAWRDAAQRLPLWSNCTRTMASNVWLRPSCCFGGLAGQTRCLSSDGAIMLPLSGPGAHGAKCGQDFFVLTDGKEFLKSKRLGPDTSELCKMTRDHNRCTLGFTSLVIEAKPDTPEWFQTQRR